MKSHRRHTPYRRYHDSLPFDYTLLSHLYVHEDGRNVLNFGGTNVQQDVRNGVQALLDYCSFFEGATLNLNFKSSQREHPGSVLGSTFLYIQADSEDWDLTNAGADDTSKMSEGPVRRRASYLVPMDDATEHIWFVTQANDKVAPFARSFSSIKNFETYIKSHRFTFPRRGAKRATRPAVLTWLDPLKAAWNANDPDTKDGPTGTDAAQPMQATENRHRFVDPQQNLRQSLPQKVTERSTPLPITKWLDIQTTPNDPNSSAKLRKLLSYFPIHEHVVDSCLYMITQDYIDLSHLTPYGDGYMFAILICTPLQHNANTNATRHESNGYFEAETHRCDGGAGAQEKSASETFTRGVTDTKSVMELRFQAAREHLPRSSVPEPVAVGVIMFPDWLITIHEEPFAEMGDLLRMIQLKCSPIIASNRSMHNTNYHGGGAPLTTTQCLTSPFIFTSLLQIATGHHLDNVILVQAVDELNETAFSMSSTTGDQEKVLRHITDLRRCFGECGADVSRRENLVTALLHPHTRHNLVLSEPGIREQLENVQAYLHYLQHEINDCRDTVAATNWYYNVSYQWLLLIHGNRALRRLLTLTELANIMYPVVMVQTLYAMNVPVPFATNGDPPTTSLAPFFVLGAIILIYFILWSRPIYHMFFPKPFRTVLLA